MPKTTKSSMKVVKKVSAKDDEVPPFHRKVYEQCSLIPKGKVCTYKELAKAIGNPNAYRAVGSALRNNPFAPKVPCHRVVAADLTLGGFHGSTDPNGEMLGRKVKMLIEEGVEFEESSSKSAKRVKSTCVHTF